MALVAIRNPTDKMTGTQLVKAVDMNLLRICKPTFLGS